MRVKDVVVPSGPRASFSGSVFNLSNSVVGVGMLSLALTASWSGLLFMVIAMILLAGVMFVSCQMLLAAGIFFSIVVNF